MGTKELINAKESQILEYKAYLNETDYKVIKHAEGYEISEETLANRADARIKINILEVEIEDLKTELEKQLEDEINEEII